MYFLIVFAIGYTFYKQGVRYLFKNIILDDNRSGFLGYIFLMISGVSMGEFVSLNLLPYFFSPAKWDFIFFGTLISIVSGEYMYLRNYRFINRMVTIEKK